MPEDMPAERVYDPDLGRERNALPGEIVKPEEEKTLQRLMREGREYFQEVYERVKKDNETTKQFSEDELELALKLGEAFARVKRREYLEAIRANPVNEIRKILLSVQTEVTASFFAQKLKELEKSIQEIVNEVQGRRVADKRVGRPIRSTLDYVQDGLRKNDRVFERILDINTSYSTQLVKESVNTLVEKFGVVPVVNFTLLKELASSLDNTNDDQRPTGSCDSNSYSIDRLPLGQPGLEGVLINLEGGRFYVFGLSLKVNAQGMARIVDAEEKVQPQGAK